LVAQNHWFTGTGRNQRLYKNEETEIRAEKEGKEQQGRSETNSIHPKSPKKTGISRRLKGRSGPEFGEFFAKEFGISETGRPKKKKTNEYPAL